jgi:hypothetical protein
MRRLDETIHGIPKISPSLITLGASRSGNWIKLIMETVRTRYEPWRVIPDIGIIPSGGTPDVYKKKQLVNSIKFFYYYINLNQTNYKN